MVSFLMLGSLILGLIAWTLPVISIMKIKKGKNEICSVLSFFSTILCAVSLYFQIYYNYY